MRIISGKYKGRKLNPPKNLPVRPTTDFAKEGLFNVLRSRFNVDSSKVLDLFCGTGNMSFEFISRGAELVCSVDQNRACINYVKKQAADLGIETIQTYQSEVLKYLKREDRSFDLIFADPPYSYQEGVQLVDLSFEKELIKPNSYFILEHGKDQEFKDHQHYQFDKRFGNVNFTFFAKVES